MNFKIPIITFLLFFLSKEVFSYDSEKVVVLCILSFIILTYFNSKEALHNIFLARTQKLKEEYKDLAIKKAKLETEIRRFWRIFLDLEDQLMELYLWVKINVSQSINKFNKHREYLIFCLVKDQMNSLLKEKLKIDQFISEFIFKNALNNFKLMLTSNYAHKSLYINDLNFYLNKLININPKYNILDLIINKLSINKEVYGEKLNNWINFSTFFKVLHVNK